MGIRYSTPVSNPPSDVFTCCQQRVERGGTYVLLGLPGQHLGTESTGGPICYGEWWGIGHPIKKFKTSIKVFTYYEGYWVFLLVGASWEGGPFKISAPPCKIRCIGVEYPATTEEDSELWGEQWPRPNRQEPYEEALRAAHQRALDTTEALQGDIERLSWRTRGRLQTHSRTHSQSCIRSPSRSRSRSHSRAHSQSHSLNSSQSRQPQSPDGPPLGRRVTFREPVVEPNPEGNVEDHMAEPSVSNVEMWLEWQAKQLGTPAWWPELKAILGYSVVPRAPEIPTSKFSGVLNTIAKVWKL